MRRFVMLFFLGGLLSAAAGWADGTPPPVNSPVLYVPFDNTLDAEISFGAKAPLYYDKNISFTEGIKGKAVVLKGEGVAYPVPGHINRNQGTIMFWFKGFDPSDLTARRYARQKMFFEVGNWNESMRLYWPGNGQKMLFYEFFCMGDKVNKVECGFFQPEGRWVSPDKWPLQWSGPEQWHHIAAIWQNGREAKFYFDGRLIFTVPDITMPAELSPDFVLGRGTPELHLDELKVYSKPLSADMIGALYDEAAGELRNRLMSGRPEERLVSETELKPSLEREPWYDNQLGEEDYVPTPWEPIKVHGARISTWGSVYDCRGILPERVTLRDGTDLFAGPPAIQLESSDGGRLNLSAGEHRIIQRGRGSCSLRDTADGDGLSVQSLKRVEFDGFITNDLVVEIKKNLRLNRIWLEIPLRREHARYYNIGGSRSAYLEHFGPPSGRIPEAGLNKNFEPYVWIGDEDRGFAVCTESPRNWINTRPDQVIQLFYQGNSLIARINLCDAETDFRAGQVLRYRFGFLATPSRPFMPGRRLLRIHGLRQLPGDTPSNEARRGVEAGNVLALLPWRWSSPWMSFQPLAADTLAGWQKRQAELARRFRKIYTAPYENFQELGYQAKGQAEADWYMKYHDVMALFPASGKRTDWYGDRAFAFCSASTAAADFWVWSFSRLLDRAPAMNSIYIDETYPYYCASDQHGCRGRGILGDDAGRYPVFAQRELMKRICIVAKQKRPDFIFWTHDSQFLLPPQRSFSDISTSAEPIVFNTVNPLDALSLDRIKAEFLGRQFGVVSLYLPGVIGEDRGRVALGADRHPNALLCSERLVHLLFLHDVQIWGIRFLVAEPIEDLWEACNRYGLDDAAEFVPYWEIEQGKRKEARSPANANVKISVYKLKNRNLLVTVYNTGDKPYDGRITLDWKALGNVRYGQGLAEVVSGTRAGKGAVRVLDPSGLEIAIGAKDGMNVGIRLK